MKKTTRFLLAVFLIGSAIYLIPQIKEGFTIEEPGNVEVQQNADGIARAVNEVIKIKEEIATKERQLQSHIQMRQSEIDSLYVKLGSLNNQANEYIQNIGDIVNEDVIIEEVKHRPTMDVQPVEEFDLGMQDDSLFNVE